MILVGAKFFSHVFQEIEGDEKIKALILDANLGPHAFLVLVMIVIFIAGFFIDFIEITTIIVPIVAPIFFHFDIPLTWIGILIAINLQTSFLTPPFGFSLFYLKGVAPPEIKTGHLYRGIIPFIIIQAIVIAFVAFFPKTATWHLKDTKKRTPALQQTK